jgi:hypothetical protein
MSLATWRAVAVEGGLTGRLGDGMLGELRMNLMTGTVGRRVSTEPLVLLM